MMTREKLLIILAFIAIPMILVGCGKEEGGEETVIIANPQQDSNTGTTVTQDNTTGTTVTQDNTTGTTVISPPPYQEEAPVAVYLNQEVLPANCLCPDMASIIISQNGTSNLSVSVKLSSVNLFSYGFYLAYDPNVYQFVSYEPTSAMGNEGETLATAVEMSSTEGAAAVVFSGNNAQPGKRVVLVSHPRLGYDMSGISVNEIVGKINFKIKTKSPANFIFSGTSILERNGARSPVILKNHCWPQQLVIQ